MTKLDNSNNVNYKYLKLKEKYCLYFYFRVNRGTCKYGYM